MSDDNPDAPPTAPRGPFEPPPPQEGTSSVVGDNVEPVEHGSAPLTHLLWDGESVMLVSLEGHDPDDDNLLPAPEGMTSLDFHKPDFEARTLALDTAALNAILHGQIDEGAGALRKRFITDVPGQEMTYVRKEKEGRDYVAGGAGPWPMLEAEAAATGQDIVALAANVVAQADQIIALGALIEGARMGAKAAVRAAATEAEKRAASLVDWDALLQR